eukprot:TRINITY_DN7110_c0_g2_i1.p1 TRINITY_DN7110_c0_g2~~TRINITY_DN7110_c0_g2_i1.p1  ORF type:complete len:673 (-),score=101.19 TRINITY_DN7110_c0_g2_i1:30-2048(-)
MAAAFARAIAAPVQGRGGRFGVNGNIQPDSGLAAFPKHATDPEQALGPTVGSSCSRFKFREGLTLEWDVSVVAGLVPILSRSVGRALQGEVCCILGPSGAGKSTLLNVLAGRQLTKRCFQIDGELRVNGALIEPRMLRPKVAYVMQKDEFFASETPRESMLFSARLRLAPTHLARLEERGDLHSHVSDLLNALGLSVCCDRPIGGASLNGISNGERKRVSIGVELITQPSVVFLDEPTTGLDTFSAWQVMSIVKELAKSGCTVICTVHQPSSEIFALVDRVICLCHRRTIFQGKALELTQWLEKCGYNCPAEHNPADYVMFLMETESRDLIDILADSEKSGVDSCVQPSAAVSGGIDPLEFRKSFALQIKCLALRELRNLWRDSNALKLRFVLTVFLSLLFSLVFANVGEHAVLAEVERTMKTWGSPRRHGRVMKIVRKVCMRVVCPEATVLQQQLQQEMEYHYKAVVQVGFVAMFSACQPTILSFPLERPVFLREFSSNMYGTVAYFVTKMLVEVPLGAFQALLALLISHRMMSLQGEFLEMWLTVCLLNTCSVSFALLIGSIVRFPRESGAIGPLIVAPQMLMSGTFIPVRAIPAYLRWMQYFSFLQYAVKLMTIVEFRHTHPMMRRLIFRTMQVDPDLAHIYIGVLVAMSVGFSFVAVRQLNHKAHSIY